MLAVGGSLAALLFTGPDAMAAQTVNEFKFRYIITDRRHVESLEFCNVFTAHGATRLEVTDGLTQIWQDVLVPHWREPSGVIAGMTSRGVWNCLAEQARSQGRRSVLIGRHAIEPNASAAVHFITAPPAALNIAATLDGRRHVWPEVMARLVRSCSPDERARGGEWRSELTLPSQEVAHSLVSWIIV